MPHASPPPVSPSISPAKAGRMTAVMRALAPQTGARVLRVGLVRGGRVVEERIFKHAARVTVGRDESCTFVAGDAAPAHAVVLDYRDGAYHLDVRAASSGRVALVDGIHDVAALRSRATGGEVVIDESARGRIVIGDATLLFQFVAAPPAPLRARLPLAVRGGVTLDWRLTVIAAFSFLSHFGVVGAMYSDWTDPIVDEQIVVGGVVESLAHLAAPAPDPLPDQLPHASAPDRTAKDDAHPTHETHATPTPHPPTDRDSRPQPPTSDRDAAQMAREAKALGIGMIAAFGATSAVDNTLRRSEIPPIDLTDAARSSASASRGETQMGSHDGVVGPLSKNGLKDLVATTGPRADATLHAAGFKPPPTFAETSPPQMTVRVPNAEAVIAQLRPKFRSCYNRGLEANPTMQGSVTIRAKIGPNGEVIRADPTATTGLSDAVSACVARVIANAQFDAPGPSGSTLDVPVKLVQQAH